MNPINKNTMMMATSFRRAFLQATYQRSYQQTTRSIQRSACAFGVGSDALGHGYLGKSNDSRNGRQRRHQQHQHQHQQQYMTTTKKKALSKRDLASMEDYFLEHLGPNIQDPVLTADLRSLDWIQRRIKQAENGDLVVTLSLPSLLHPNIKQLQEQTQQAATNLLEQFFNQNGHFNSNTTLPTVHVDTVASKPFPAMARRAQDHQEYIQKLGPGLAHITHFLAVYSCKGGVGKSTIAVNLAYELARMGGRVGLLDVDIYGPSLPVLIHPDDAAVYPSPMGRGMIYPIHHRGIKIMSLGYVSPGSGVPGSGPQGGAAVMRGPMAGKVVAQLLKGTDWGELDVLVLDLPPGTGDVQLAVCQDLQLSGAVAVTTPSKLALSDAKKGIEMFTSLGVPTLAAVENMAYFVCDGGGRHYPFGKGEALLDDSSTTSVFQLPISTATNDANDSGSPLCLDRPAAATEELTVFQDLAYAISKELLLVQHNRTTTTTTSGHDVDAPHRVSFQGNTKVLFDVASTYLAVASDNQGFVARFFSENGATEVIIAGTNLRERDPKTGNVLGNSGNGMVQHHVANPPLLFPAKVERKGRYGYAVEYADGQTIIYSMLAIAKAAGGSPAEI